MALETIPHDHFRNAPLIIDAHTHIFSPDHQRYPLANPRSSYRPQADGRVETLKAAMDAAGVQRAVTISPWFYGWNIDYTLEALAAHSEWLAVVALVPPTAPDAPAILERYVQEFGVCGLRIQGQISGLAPFDDPAATPLWEKAADLALPIDVNATHEEYPQVEKRLRDFPTVPVILDHCGYISGDLAPKIPTLDPVLRLAEYPNAYAKLTFLGLASQEDYPFRDVHWMVRQLVDFFGPERCLFGSNFPTAQYNDKMNYAQTVQVFQEELDLPPVAQGWILGGTAGQLWQWREQAAGSSL
jgi:L-fuconolactonase